MPTKKKPTDRFITTIRLNPTTNAWLAYQSAIEETTRDQIIDRALRDYHAKAAKKNPHTPPIE